MPVPPFSTAMLKRDIQPATEPSPRGEEKHPRYTTANFDAIRAEVFMRQSVAQEVKYRSPEERRGSRPAHSAGGGACRHMERDDHGRLPTRCAPERSESMSKSASRAGAGTSHATHPGNRRLATPSTRMNPDYMGVRVPMRCPNDGRTRAPMSAHQRPRATAKHVSGHSLYFASAYEGCSSTSKR